jgi:hypothetical protein
VRRHVAALIDAAVFVTNAGRRSRAAAVRGAVADVAAGALAVGRADARLCLAENLEEVSADGGARWVDGDAAARVGCADVVGDERPSRLAGDGAREDVVPLGARFDDAGVGAVHGEEDFDFGDAVGIAHDGCHDVRADGVGGVREAGRFEDCRREVVGAGATYR